MSKKIFGVVFILLAAILTLAIVGQVPDLFGIIVSFFAMITGKLESYRAGETIGRMIYWLLHFAFTITLWRYGLRWVRKPIKATNG